ncbi:MAG: N-acetylmuramoyl-L-alanine amidase, partial [Polaribacter sp.]|nr:N-acetylmuramoyl-L-alanine amidase [Polaribacter sp.]
REAYKAAFTVGDLYEKLYAVSRRKSDIDAAVKFYQKTVKEFKKAELTDDALFRQGKIFFSQKRYNAAINSFETILNVVPDGDIAVKAKGRIANVKLLLAKQALLKKTKHIAPLKISSNLNNDKILTLNKINYTVGVDSVQVVVHINKAVSFTQRRISNPERVYFNFKDTQIGSDVAKNIKIGSPFLKGLRLSELDEKNTRLVFDLSKTNNLKIGVWPEGSKLLVELSNKKLPVSEVASKSKVSTTPNILKVNKKVKNKVAVRKKIVKASPKRSSPVSNKKVPLIVVDAGHGGKDYGAKGHSGLKEKEVNLAIALRLEKILKSRYKYRVILTRKKDTFISLPGRGEIANDNNGDVFVSVHANAAPRRGAHGIETYYLGSGHSEEAKATAARENGKLVRSVNDDQTQEILASMISTTKINKSSRLASNIQHELAHSMRKKYSGIKDLGVKEGPFFVLHDTNMASVLVEVGFVTNSKEERRLKQSAYLDNLASSIAKGIVKFIQSNDPMI